MWGDRSLFAVVKNSDSFIKFRIGAREGDTIANKYTVSDTKFYDIVKKEPHPTIRSKAYRSWQVPLRETCLLSSSRIEFFLIW